MLWRNGVMAWMLGVMALLLSGNEADCLIPQHRKQILSINHPTVPDRSSLPRERFSPMYDMLPFKINYKPPRQCKIPP